MMAGRRGILPELDNPTFTAFLDFSRWMAALIVFLGHLRNPMFLGYGALPPESRTLLVGGWYFVTGWHAEAVVVFFVLSGYLVGGLAATKARKRDFRPVDYSIDRLTRLYVPYFPALLLTLALDSLGARLFGDLGLYDRTHPMVIEKINSEAFSTYLSFEIFVKNLFMQQTIWAPPLGSNTPLWTISLEFWFYVIFGIVAAAVQYRSLPLRLLAALALLGLLVLLGWGFLVYMGLWLFGVLVALVRFPKLERPVLAAAALIGILVLSRIYNVEIERGWNILTVRNYAVAAAYAWLLLSMRGVRLRPLEFLGGLNRQLADFSFSLYLIHFPLMLFLIGVFYHSGKFSCLAEGCSATNSMAVLAYVSIALLVVVGAWLFALATERQTGRVRSRLRRILKPFLGRSVERSREAGALPSTPARGVAAKSDDA